MSLDLTITQKGLFKKTLPLSVILGDKLRYGSYDDGRRLQEGKMGDGWFSAFLPQAIARGFNVTWNAQEAHHVDMRLMSPTGRKEIKEFYATAGRIMQYWNAELRVDGEKIRFDDWMAGLDNFIAFNTQCLKTACQRINDGEFESLTWDSAFWRLTIGKEEACYFADNPDAFESWLHEKQSIDAYYASPTFYKAADDSIFGCYTFSEDCLSIFPAAPSVPLGRTDPDTGKQLVCNDYRVALFSPTEGKIIGILSFDSFIKRLPTGKITRYDHGHNLIAPMSLSEL